MKYLLWFMFMIGLIGCGAPQAASESVPPTLSPSPATPAPQITLDRSLHGSIAIDGSSTVFPITEYIAQMFRQTYPNVEIQLGVSGTSGGFKRFCAGETEISDASRPIKASEIELCSANDIEFVEVPIAYDGISVLVHPENTWAECLTVAELKQIWEPAATEKIDSWNDVRPEWPDLPLTLYGAGADSGTYDYFTAAIVGEEGLSRSDYIGSEDDYLLAQDIASDPHALGFFGYAYYQEYQASLKLIAIDAGSGCVLPSAASINNSTYQPLSRPMFIYINRQALSYAATVTFVDFYLQEAAAAAQAVRSVPLPERAYQLGRLRVERPIIGSIFAHDMPLELSIEDLLELEDQAAPRIEQ